MKLFFKIAGIILLLISNVLEIVAVRILLTRTEDGHLYALFFHVIAALVMVIALVLFKVKLQEKNTNTLQQAPQQSFYANPMLIPAFFMVIFIPIFGPITVSILALLIKPVSQKKTELFVDYIDYIKSIDPDMERFEKLPEERLILKFLRIEPVVDLLGSRSKSMVWGSIDNLSKRADQIAVDLIRSSIRQDDAEIKFLASIGLEKMEKQLLDRIENSHIELLEKDDLPSHRHYIESVLDYLNCGISPAELNTAIINEALRAVNSAEERFQAGELRFFHAQILARANQFEKSLKIMEELLNNEKLETEMIPFAMDSYFKAGNLDRVKQLITRFVASDKAGEILENQFFEIDVNELKEFWLGSAMEAQK